MKIAEIILAKIFHSEFQKFLMPEWKFFLWMVYRDKKSAMVIDPNLGLFSWNRIFHVLFDCFLRSLKFQNLSFSRKYSFYRCFHRVRDSTSILATFGARRVQLIPFHNIISQKTYFSEHISWAQIIKDNVNVLKIISWWIETSFISRERRHPSSDYEEMGSILPTSKLFTILVR